MRLSHILVSSLFIFWVFAIKESKERVHGCNRPRRISTTKTNNQEDTMKNLSRLLPYSKRNHNKRAKAIKYNLTGKFIQSNDISGRSETPKNIRYVRNERSTDDPCYMFGTCGFVSTLPLHVRHCHCDDRCEKYNDCCPERLKGNNATIRVSNPGNGFKCLKNGTSRVAVFGTFVVTTCLPSFKNRKLKTLCSSENITSYGGLVCDETGIVFHNSFCAICNNITNFTFFSVRARHIRNLQMTEEVNKTNKQRFSLIFGHKVVFDYIPPPGIISRSCLVVNTAETNSERCLNYGSNPVMENSLVYRNYFCTSQFSTGECFGDYKDSNIWFDFYAMTVMFQFSPGCKEVSMKILFFHSKEAIKKNSTVERLKIFY